MTENGSTLIAPSILSADFGRLSEEIKAVENAGADVIHVDIMDGHFVPNITIGPLVVKAVRASTGLPVDCHLMIERPDLYLKDFRDAGADWISVHYETCPHIHRTLCAIKQLGAKAGLVLNPGTPVNAVRDVIEVADYCLIMSVNPGFGGQAFIDFSLEKIRELKALLDAKGLSIPIQVDGGINRETIGKVAQAGATIFVAGSAIFGADDYATEIKTLRKIAQA
ncbi:Ribulose-phosphate 3-epimerase [Dissulfuribacter thermophilus]|uniref:Ribulose-phosphate 3-epimerase n=1 Tax=Dissulfuribacter thermophilus TaxID=1156395 RepID=A0A1B9F785_9BACT|nr:ribulose-phosphate 3-epimerase [Dissulfuribacter thermophilus]OCC15797.1 Ribulose-phosphate 3-epimerase [Dissulfuribacter thermophilus]